MNYRSLNWSSAVGRGIDIGPEIRVIRDESSLANLLNDLRRYSNEKPKFDEIDFTKEKAVAVFWGRKSRTGYEMNIRSVRLMGDTLTLRIETRIWAIGGFLVTSPAIVIAVPKSRQVRVEISGDRCQPGTSDFTSQQKSDLEVKVTGSVRFRF